MEPAEHRDLDLRGYVTILRRRKWVVVAVAAVAVGAGLAVSLSTTPRYRASAEVLIAPKRSETLFASNGGQLPQDTSRYVATEIRVLTSEFVRDAAVAKLGYRARVTARGSRDDNVVTLSAESVSPRRAADTVNTYVDAYIEYRRKATVEDSLKAQSVIQGQVDEKQRELEALDAALGRAPAGEREAVAASQREERASLVSQQRLFDSQIDQLQIGAGLNSGEAQLLTAASVPTAPFEPNPPATAALSLFLGLVLGVGIAFLVEYLDDSVRTKDDLERSTTGLPVLGLIPLTPGWKEAEQARTVTLRAPASVAAEAYRSLRTSIQFLGLDTPVRTLQVTSPSSSEGKTTTVANLCVALATAGQRVVVVDCDLRRSRVHEFFGLGNGIGFTSVLLGDAPLSEALVPAPGVDGLYVLASGPRPPNPSELLSGPRTIEVLLALQGQADIVVFDSPPVLPVSDALVLAARVDATLLVAKARTTSRRSLGRALELLQQVDAPVVGTVLNGAAADEGYGYGYGYGYGAAMTGRAPDERPAPVPSR